ncbi:MAG: type IV toxin-antitoxin system AbiEi family antitoxin domain-containing protein [Armatimonadetes bacterium]|nr:type IV toxin-antitoxin system AbiEi family antitoxin domain-containing protein [Armatimonadota bacterium]
MTARTLKSGRVYRTRELKRYGQNPTRLAARLVETGELRRLQKGLYYKPRRSIFGEVPPSEDELLRAYFGRQPYLRTGPSVWNALGLGSTAVEAVPLVYNKKRSGVVELADRWFEFRRVRFPARAPVEYFIVDLLENAQRAGLEQESARRALAAALRNGSFDRDRLRAMASGYGTLATQRFVAHALADCEDSHL